MTTVRIDATQAYIVDADDCLEAAAERYVSEHPETEGWDLGARWENNDSREVILLDAPRDDAGCLRAALAELSGCHAQEYGYGYTYWAAETRRWYLVDESDLVSLGERVLAEESDAYSLWCSATDATEMPAGWDPSLPEVSRDDIQALRSEAASAGDDAMVQICRSALDGDADSVAECARVIGAARAQEED